MRQALNENPVVQAAIVGVLVIVVGFIFLTGVLSPGAEEAPPGVGAEAVAPGVEGVAPATGAAAPVETIGAAGAVEAPPPSAFEPGPGLPRPVVAAYEARLAVAILVTRRGGIEDRRLRGMLDRIVGVGDVAVFHAYAAEIAEFSRITGGVDVSRVPALVVIRPRDRSQTSMPVASVSYGFRGPESAEQAVRDALYTGPRNLPYHPR